MKKVLFFILFHHSFLVIAVPLTLNPKTNIFTIIPNKPPIRLHLGCGQTKLSGYINIDYPLSNHTIQTKSGADVFSDVTQIIFPKNSIDEIRHHHFFEHFDRQKSLALLAIWHHALRLGGILYIETPDFHESIRLLLQPSLSYVQKQQILRHIWGSHEAFWAYHYDGWYEEKYRHVLSALGFEINHIQKNSYKMTRNITITAKKVRTLDIQQLQSQCHQLLKEYMICDALDEYQMWQIWCQEFDKNFLPYI